jgi:hypothetical protein
MVHTAFLLLIHKPPCLVTISSLPDLREERPFRQICASIRLSCFTHSKESLHRLHTLSVPVVPLAKLVFWCNVGVDHGIGGSCERPISTYPFPLHHRQYVSSDFLFSACYRYVTDSLPTSNASVPRLLSNVKAS